MVVVRLRAAALRVATPVARRVDVDFCLGRDGEAFLWAITARALAIRFFFAAAVSRDGEAFLCMITARLRAIAFCLAVSGFAFAGVLPVVVLALTVRAESVVLGAATAATRVWIGAEMRVSLGS